MSLKRYAAARDANEPEIVAALRAVGASVRLLDSPADLLVGFREVTFLIECKLPPGSKGGLSRSQLTPDQKDFHATWRGQIAIVRTPEEALRVIGAI